MELIKNEIIVPTGKVLITIRDGKTGKIKSEDLNDNMFLTVGKNSIAKALAGETADDQGIITYCALGTGTNAPALANTQLQTELVRKLVSVRSYASNVATFQTFFTTAEGNGTLREAGLFGDLATAVANSGTCFCRVAINRTKSASDTLTLSWAVTIG